MSSTKTIGPARKPKSVSRRLRQPSLAQQLVSQLSARIARGAFARSGRLPTEALIIEEFGVSRTVVREAISRLSAAGLVETRHGIGTFILAPGESRNFRIDASELATLAEVLAVLELRISMEGEAACMAAGRRSTAQLGALRQALDAFAGNIAAGETVPHDYEFHRQVAAATGNRYFVQFMEYLGTMIIPRTRINSAGLAGHQREAYLQLVHREHEGIFNAIRQRDGATARQAMRAHLENSRDRLRRAHEAARKAIAPIKIAPLKIAPHSIARLAKVHPAAARTAVTRAKLKSRS